MLTDPFQQDGYIARAVEVYHFLGLSSCIPTQDELSTDYNGYTAIPVRVTDALSDLYYEEIHPWHRMDVLRLDSCTCYRLTNHEYEQTRSKLRPGVFLRHCCVWNGIEPSSSICHLYFAIDLNQDLRSMGSLGQCFSGHLVSVWRADGEDVQAEGDLWSLFEDTCLGLRNDVSDAQRGAFGVLPTPHHSEVVCHFPQHDVGISGSRKRDSSSTAQGFPHREERSGFLVETEFAFF
jgi:hypothetical protein